MPLRDFIAPRFWLHPRDSAPERSLFNYRRAWALAIVLTALTALVPLTAMTLIDYQVTRSAVEAEVRLRTSRIVSNARRAVSFYLEERASVLSFVLQDRSPESLRDPVVLGELLDNLKRSHGGFVDLGVIDSGGVQRAYVGPYSLLGRDYSDQGWFDHVVSEGSYVSDVFLGFRNVPHLVIAVRQDLPGGGFFVLRATLDTDRFNNLAGLDLLAGGDSFIINAEGVLQTPSRHHGAVLDVVNLPVPPYSEYTEIMAFDEGERELTIGYAYVPNSPFILLVVKSRDELMASWYDNRFQMVWLLAASVVVILLVVTAVATFLVNLVFQADRNRFVALHHAEHANKMASIGRLAAGVAHEINNPLAVIGEKSGLLKDLLTYRSDDLDPARLRGLAEEIASSVERCGNITKHLLGFARHINVRVERINVERVIEEVLSFLRKEAEYRSVGIAVNVAPGLPEFECDRGKLQQILLNLVNNAFQAVADHGHVEIAADSPDSGHLRILVRDDGCGIRPEDQKRIFEPFYSTKCGSGGTGLGLSITYGLVRKLGGVIEVESRVGQGTTFTITLPAECGREEGESCEYC
ncbi:PAS domain-containing sensor histidine kinase [Desulfocurvus sp.]|jgi:signal transduction histidine kinase|uniref:sensor histidine kinase n=1 Tax=Desulfocurvus sp. TaxID=2871698 RepID=UPI0025B803CB|nr:PAS domain-containing sensor histidine kinase [Desulfocurvus sp.]MCK9240345.1 ATP-binding protein [Desulfocurvus sp.]